ncbi:MAG: DUF87 domain-containing protein [Candidatus Brockarchaeota archaeon]|nr:DUF87 domain-containing protein [Candidatus Brockarchaeota archaeon]
MAVFVKSFAKFLFLASATVLGILLLWRLLQAPGDAIHLRKEVAALSTPLEIAAIVYIAARGLMSRFKLGERWLSAISYALKASFAFYAAGLAALVAGQAELYGLAGFSGASAYALGGKLFAGSQKLHGKFARLPGVYLPLPSSNPIPEMPVSICTPPVEGVMVSYNLYLGEEAKSWICFNLNRLQSLSKPFREHVQKMARFLGSDDRSWGSARKRVPDPRRHLSKGIKMGYSLDSTRSIEETLKALKGIGRRGVEASIQFAWVRRKGGVMARHVLLASSNDVGAFSRFETDLVRKLPFLNHVEAGEACRIMMGKEEGSSLTAVGEAYLRNVLPLGLSYELATSAEKALLRGYVEAEGGKPFSVPLADGHVLVVGGKSSGKTRFAKSLVSALGETKATVLVVDPHGEYPCPGHAGGKKPLNPFKPPLGVDILTHSGSLLVFSQTLASAFDAEDPQGRVSELVRMEEPSLKGYLLEIAGNVDEESSRLRAAISKLVEETGIDEAVREASLPSTAQGVLRVRTPRARGKKAAAFLTELFSAWAASLAVSRQGGRVAMVVEDADEMLDASEMPKILGYAKECGLSIVLVSRGCARMAEAGPFFSIVAGFRMASQEEISGFLKLVGVGGDEPEGMQVEAAIGSLQRCEGLVFFRNRFEFAKIKPVENGGGAEGDD